MPHNDDEDYLEIGPDNVIPFRDVAEPVVPARLRPLPIARWDHVPVPEQDWVVLNRIPRRQTCLFSGEGAMGKSTLLLQLCAAHAAARDWLYTMPEPGPALFVDSEDDQDTIHRRLAAVAAHYRITFADLDAGGLSLMSLVGDDALLVTVNRRSGKVEPTPLYHELFSMVGDTRPVMIGLCSAANFFAGEERDRSQVQQFVSLLTRLAIVANGAVVLVSHPSLSGIASGTGVSGSTAWHNSVRSRIFLHGVKKDDAEGGEPDNDLRELEFRKNNYGKIDAKVTLRWRDGLFLPEPKPSVLAQVAQNARDDDLFMRLLALFTAQNRNVSPNKGAYFAPFVFSETSEARAAHANSARLRSAMERLFDAGRIKAEEFGPPSRRRSRLVVR